MAEAIPGKVQVNCPNCRTLLTVDAATQTFSCPACGTTLKLSFQVQAAPAPAPAPEPAREPIPAPVTEPAPTQSASDAETLLSAAGIADAAASAADAAAAAAAMGGVDLGVLEEVKRAAEEAARAAREAEAIARQSTAVAEESLRESTLQTERVMAEAEAMAKEAEERRIAQEVERRLAEERARAERERAAAAAAAAAEAARQQAEAEAARQAAMRAAEEARRNDPETMLREAGIESDGTVRDRSTGYGLFYMPYLPGWRVTATSLRQQNTNSRPYVPQIELRDGNGGIINVRLGEGGTRQSAALKAMMAMYGTHLIGIDTTNVAEMPDPINMADAAASQVAQGMNATNLHLIEQLANPNLSSLLEPTLALWKRSLSSGGPAMVTDPLVAVVLRVYGFNANGIEWKMASFIKESAVKEGVDLGGIGGNLFGGLFGGKEEEQDKAAEEGGIMGFLKGGGLVGKIRRDQRAAQQKKEAEANPQMAALAAERPVSTGGVKWSVPDFASYNNTGTIFWSVESVINFVAPASDFDAQFQSAFMTIIEKVHLHSDVESLASQFIANEAARIQGRTNVALQQQQAQFQAMQAANAQVQAAHDAQVQQWFRNSDAHHQAFRAATNAQFNSAPGSSAPDYSEAIRGVNTYRTSDGREVEISVSADRAWENQAGDVIGTSGATEPGADWTQLPLA